MKRTDSSKTYGFTGARSCAEFAGTNFDPIGAASLIIWGEDEEGSRPGCVIDHGFRALARRCNKKQKVMQQIRSISQATPRGTQHIVS